MKNKQLINHVALVIDDSGSMTGLKRKTIEVIDKQVAMFAKTGKAKDQETRLTILTFGSQVDEQAFDREPSRVPDARSYYYANQASTCLIDGTYEAIEKLREIRQGKSEDHSFLVYVITDGIENSSRRSRTELIDLINGLNDDWTVAAIVPNAYAQSQCKSYGIPAGNIEIWETTEQGMEEVGSTIGATYSGYAAMRSSGVKSSKKLFEFKSVLNKKDVAGKLEPVPAKEYQTLLVRKYDDGKAIKDFVEKMTGEAYRVGSAYYQLSKPEIIQGSKTIAVIEKSTGRMYSGNDARPTLGLPNYDVKVAPADFDKFDVFVQSTSTNRKLVQGTSLVVFK